MSKDDLKVTLPWRKFQAKMADFTKLTGDYQANGDSNDSSVSIPQTWKTVGIITFFQFLEPSFHSTNQHLFRFLFCSTHCSLIAPHASKPSLVAARQTARGLGTCVVRSYTLSTLPKRGPCRVAEYLYESAYHPSVAGWLHSPYLAWIKKESKELPSLLRESLILWRNAGCAPYDHCEYQ